MDGSVVLGYGVASEAILEDPYPRKPSARGVLRPRVSLRSVGLEKEKESWEKGEG